MKVLVVGSGGREHALVRKLAASPQEPRIFASPGNPGTSQHATNIDLDITSFAEVTKFCLDTKIDLVIVGPEDPLINGLADCLRRDGIAVFGPGAMGSRLEGDKEFAKEVLASAGVSTPHYQAFSSTQSALKHLDKVDLPVVVKACGAAQGKGVAVCATREEAERHIRSCLQEQVFGQSGLRIILEDCLFGPELSVLIVTDGQDYCLLAPSRDHKRIGEFDVGPNTGGMGAFAPVSLPQELFAEIDTKIVLPILAELRRRDIPYRGVLYAGLMLTQNGPQVLEFNCRFGDPETQVVLPLYLGDFLDLCWTTATGQLGRHLQGAPHDESDGPAGWSGAGLTAWGEHAVVVVAAADGYPGAYLKDRPIDLPDESAAGSWVIHAGTRQTPAGLVTDGGRVLGVVGHGTSLDAARQAAYGLLDQVHFEGLTFRRDIAGEGKGS